MGEESKHVAHCLVLAYPAQGHINPMIEFSKRLIQRGLKITLVSTVSFWNTTTPHTLKSLSSSDPQNIQVESISDGYDNGGLAAAESLEIYKETFWKVGPRTLSNLIQKLASNNNPVDCVICDGFLYWALDVAKDEFGILGALFFTQPCAVNNIYFHVYKKWLELPLSESEYLIPGLPKLAASELPSFLYDYGSYPGYFDIIRNQFCNIHKADWVLANTFYELESQVVNWLKEIWPLKTIGPCVPSMYLDKRLLHDNDYGVSIYDQNIDSCIKWLNDKTKGSVVYVSFGSMAGLTEKQTEELAFGLKESDCYFLWVVRDCDHAKIPKWFLETNDSEKGLVVTWCPQLLVLTHDAVGCFLTHCGWNSTLEAICFGVPTIAMPLWTDQITNAKHIKDVWKMGVRVDADEKGLVRRESIGNCIKEILESEKGNEIKNNALKWRNLAKDSVDEGGSSDQNITEFVAKLAQLCST
ncbi:UDP-glycosyltransferase 74F2 [Arachis ipaensis]|nr:UDP-glycosyltransferase 74F2 [Arachis ipaensis]QHN75539.1 UDP-glycosyltransferase [Arachis hypogaea]